jgi:eukaryotic-like serine/threonine-protein kinase
MPSGGSGDPVAPDASGQDEGGGLLSDRYRVIRRLGAGGMARVDLAEDVRLGREVAVKRLHSGRPEEDARRFAREARLGATLNHPNLVTVFDTASEGDSVLIVMEYVGGTTLAAMLDSGPLDEQETVRILEALAAAIDHAHQHGVVHRDVKPANVLIRQDGVVKLADLGIARALEDTAITHSGVVLGSLPYIAPEALRGDDIGPEADVYSLALIAYEALTGRRARRDGTVPEVTLQAVNAPPPDLSELRPDLPPAAAEIMTRALDPEPSRRPPSATAFVRDLREALTEPNEPAPDAPPAIAVVEDEPPPDAPPPLAFPTPAQPRAPVPPAKPGREGGSPRRRALLAIVSLLALAAIAAVAVLVAGGGGSGGAAQTDNHAGSKAGAGGGAATAASSKAGSASGSTASSASPSSPDGAVEAFYQRSAAGDYGGAWELADSSFRSQLGGFAAFQSQQSTLQSIEFRSIDVTSESGSNATVSFSTVATHTSFVDRCTGSMTLVTSSETWLIDRAQNISCARSAA